MVSRVEPLTTNHELLPAICMVGLTMNFVQSKLNDYAKQTQFFDMPENIQIAITLVITITNNHELLPAYGGMNYSKQTQSNPIYGEQTQRVEPSNPILPAYGGFIRRSVCLPACGGAEICENMHESVIDFEYN